MKKRLVVFLSALLLFTLTAPAMASVDHWTCSNDQTVMYMVLDTEDAKFFLWDDKGKYLAGAQFTDIGKTKDGIPFLSTTLENGVIVGVARRGDFLILAITKKDGDNNPTAMSFMCN